MANDRLSLLIADDDDAWRETVEELLSDSYRTVVVSSGTDAIDVITAGEADFALCDLQMGSVSGLDVAEFVYSQELLLPCVLMTAQRTETVVRRARSLGVDEVLAKPVGRAELVNSVSRIAERVARRIASNKSFDTPE